jgi:hypothetical protein
VKTKIVIRWNEQGMIHLYKERELLMTLDEALEQCTDPKKPIGNRVGDKEVLIGFLPEQNCYSLEVVSPWSVEPSHLIGACLTKEEVKIRIADVSFASAMDLNGWVVSPEKW